MSFRSSTAVLLACAALLAGCESRTPQCNRLVDAINEDQAKMAKVIEVAGGPEPSSEALESYAKANDDLAAHLRRLKLKDPKISEFRDRYAELTDGLAAAVRKTSAKLGAGREAELAAAEVKGFTPKKREVEKLINDYCRGKED